MLLTHLFVKWVLLHIFLTIKQTKADMKIVDMLKETGAKYVRAYSLL